MDVTPRVNISPEDVGKLKIQSEFWKDVLKAWSMYNYYTNYRIENQIVWYNSRLRIGGKPILWCDAVQAGLLYVHQLFEDGKFKTDQQLKEEFRLTTLRVNGLKAAIPADWKEFFTENSRITYSPIPPHSYDSSITIFKDGLSRRVYQFISEDVIIMHNKFIKWRNEVGNDIFEGILDYRQAHSDLYKVTNVTKYRSFQYRLLQRALVTNIQLEKWNIIQSNLCHFCQQETETVPHLLWNCHIVQQLWRRIFQHFQQRFMVTIDQIDTKRILLNSIVQGKSHVINFLCLVVKQYIYSRKCLGKQLIYNEIISRFSKIELIEKYIAIKNNRVGYHLKKWNHIIPGQSNDINQYIQQYVTHLGQI